MAGGDTMEGWFRASGGTPNKKGCEALVYSIPYFKKSSVTTRLLNINNNHILM